MKNILLILSLLLLFACSSNTNRDKKYGWVNDSLDINQDGLRKSGRWIDTTKTQMALALYQSDTLNIMRLLILDTRGIIDLPVQLSDWIDGELTIKPIDSLEFNGEYYVVKQGLLFLYNKEDKPFGTARKLSSTY